MVLEYEIFFCHVHASFAIDVLRRPKNFNLFSVLENILSKKMLPTRHWPSKKCLYHDIFVPSLNFSRVFHSRSTEISFSLSYATGSINVCVWNMPYVPGNRWYFEKPRFVFVSFFHFKVRCNRSILFLFENLLCCKAYYSRNRQMLSSFCVVDRVVEQVLHMELQDFQIYSVSWMTNTFLWLSVFFFELVRFFSWLICARLQNCTTKYELKMRPVWRRP